MTTLQLLKRGTMSALSLGVNWADMLVAAGKLVTTFAEQTRLFRRILDLDYSDAGGI